MKKLKGKIKIKKMKEIKQVVLIRRKEKNRKKDKSEKERRKILDDFYTREIKNGKTIRADYLDKVLLMIFTFFITIILINKLINNFIISLFIGIVITFIMNNYLRKKIISQRKIKIEEIKKEYRLKLEEGGLISPNKDVEDYIVESYYKNRDEIKSNINLLGKDKILKLYFLVLIFYLGSYFVSYPIYYKIMAIGTFIAATFIGSYNLIEYMKKKDDEHLLNEDYKV